MLNIDIEALERVSLESAISKTKLPHEVLDDKHSALSVALDKQRGNL